jgi:hypothetical protein
VSIIGGIRLAHLEVPTARANGIECGNIGAWVPFSTQQLQALYPTPHDYVTKVKAAVAASVASGFVLPEDATGTIAEAEASLIGTGLECGPLCLNRGHYRPDFSSTGLLREATVYYNIRNGKDLVEIVDAAQRFTAEGGSTSVSPPRKITLSLRMSYAATSGCWRPPTQKVVLPPPQPTCCRCRLRQSSAVWLD